MTRIANCLLVLVVIMALGACSSSQTEESTTPVDESTEVVEDEGMGEMETEGESDVLPVETDESLDEEVEEEEDFEE